MITFFKSLKSKCFLNDHVKYGPYKSHVKLYRQLNKLDHVLMMYYEEMLANPFAEIKQISDNFLTTPSVMIN